MRRFMWRFTRRFMRSFMDGYGYIFDKFLSYRISNMAISILYLPQKFIMEEEQDNFLMFFDRLGCPIGMRLWMNQWLPQLCQKLWGGLCILPGSYRGGFAPHISTMQNTQAPPEFLTQLRESLIHPKPHPNGATKSIKKISKSWPGVEVHLNLIDGYKMEMTTCQAVLFRFGIQQDVKQLCKTHPKLAVYTKHLNEQNIL